MKSYGDNLREYSREYSNDQLFASTGIRNWKEKSNSYRKILNKHTTFLHDEAGIYFVDQLALTYTSQYTHLFFSHPELFVDKDFKTRYNIDKELVLINQRGKEHQYHKVYKLEFLGKYFGDLFLHKTSNTELSRIQIANEILYTESPLSIIAFLVEVASRLHLHFSNYCNYDIAYDSMNNYYRVMLLIYYQSDFCASAVHEAHSSNPLYRFDGRKRMCHNTVDLTNNSYGTFSIGSKNSASDLKIYVKTPDNEKKGKGYISRIHEDFFGMGKIVYRVEGCSRSGLFDKSKAFGKMQYDLLDLLLPERIKQNFQILIGDKLKFKKIKPIGHDKKNRNPIYDRVEIIKFSSQQNMREFDLELPAQVKTQNKEIDEFKELIYRYIEGKVPFNTIISYIISGRHQPNNHKNKNLIAGIDKAKRNCQYPISNKKRRRIDQLSQQLCTNFRSKKMLRLRLYLLFFS